MEPANTFASQLGVIIACLVAAVCGQDPRVNVQQGELEGRTLTFSEDTFINATKQIDAYLGVPYAERPPRFGAPLPKEPWSGTLNVKSFTNMCTQDSFPYMPPSSEDCLHLNVYVPNPKPAPSLAVMVWIHGGSFNTGTAMTYDFYGLPLVAVGDVILVTINYRLNIFSRFSTGDSLATGNYGMLDQVAALQWVKNNIQAFGGDPARITIFGESAGSASVNFHQLSPMSKGLFNQAVMQSGTSMSWWAFEDSDPEGDREKAFALGRAVGCDATGSQELLTCLRSKDAQDIRLAAEPIYVQYKVIRDGTFLVDTPARQYPIGNYTHVPTLMGFNKDEGTFLLLYSDLAGLAGTPTPPFISRQFFDIFAAQTAVDGYDDAPLVEETLVQEYVDWTVADYGNEVDYYRPTIDLATDSYFACSTNAVAREHANGGDPVFLYQMTHAPSGTSIFEVQGIIPFTPWLDATHAEDLIFVFGMPFIDELEGIHGHNLTDDEKALSVKFMQFWTNFAKSGDPSMPDIGAPQGVGADSWPSFTLPELRHKELSLELGEGRAARARQCHLLNEYLPDLASFTGAIDEPTREWQESYASWQGEMDAWRLQFKDYQDNIECN